MGETLSYISMKKKIILASSSPRRKEIMDELGFEYEIIPSDLHEDHARFKKASELVETLAKEKAEDVFQSHKDSIVIGADAIVLAPDGSLMGKPKNKEDARRMMNLLQNSSCKVLSAVCVISDGNTQVGHDEVSVFFKIMSTEDIDTYLDDPDADWHDKAGAFAAQGKAGEWIEKIDGEWETVLGMPKQLLLEYLDKQKTPL